MTRLLVEEVQERLARESKSAFLKDEKIETLLKDTNRSVDFLRPEYPRPQFVRDSHWLNLNGFWEFEFDFGNSGRERNLFEAKSLASRIVLPYAPESILSGIGHTDFIPAVWYRRSISIPPEWKSDRVILHIGASDFRTGVYVGGVEIGTHVGGYTPFEFDITRAIGGRSEISVTICAEDDVRSGSQAKGKQSNAFKSQGCDYTRTTGIWQTVWLERVPQTYLAGIRATPQLEAAGLTVETRLAGTIGRGYKVRATALAEGKVVGELISPASGTLTGGFLAVTDVRSWSVDDPFLYDLKLELLDGNNVVKDTVYSYFGLRSIAINGYAVEINGKSLFQRLILDQGFYPDGIYTAPSDAALKRDIDLSLELGFNGARMHQKVFEPRYLYWADKLGYLIWGEAPDWGLDLQNDKGVSAFASAWVEELERDFNHPSLVGWCPFNEHDPFANPDSIRSIYKLTKAYDPTRVVIDTSGHMHVETEIYDVHEYEQDPVKFAALFEPFLHDDSKAYETFPRFSTGRYHAGQPYWVSEYGGIKWNPGATGDAWGYGEAPKTEEEFKARYKGLTDALLDHPKMFAFCYTQLTDVEQEVNGFYYYDRSPKFDPAFFKEVNSRKAAIED